MLFRSAHVSACPACQGAAADLARVFDEPVPADSKRRIDALVAAGASKPGQQRSVWFWLVPAGGLALAAGLVWMVATTRSARPAGPDSQVARVSPAPFPSVFVVDRPAIPAGDVDLAVRGEAAKADLPNLIAAALDRADAGDVPTALAQLQGLARAHARSRHAALALGAVQLRTGQNADAATTLERARGLETNPESRDEVDWFLAVALVRTGNRDRARALLDGVCKGAGNRAKSACAGVAEIDRQPK